MVRILIFTKYLAIAALGNTLMKIKENQSLGDLGGTYQTFTYIREEPKENTAPINLCCYAW